MSYRPYPSVERATRQLGRHTHRPALSPYRQKLADQAAIILEAAAEAMRPFAQSMEQLRRSPRYGGSGRL